MQTPSRPPPKFSSFALPTTQSTEPVAGSSRSRDQSDNDESTHKSKRHRHRSPYDADRPRHSDDSERSRRKREHDHKSRDKERSRPSRRDELRVMDKIASRPVAAQLEDRTRRPSQYTLEDSGLAYYEDPYGSTGTLYLEIKYWPPGQGMLLEDITMICSLSHSKSRSSSSSRGPTHD